MATLTGPSDEPNNPGYNLAMLQRSKILPRQRPPKTMGGKARSAKDKAALMRTPESTVLIESAEEEDDIRPVAKRRRLEVPRVESDEQRHELKAAISAPKSNEQVKDDDIRIGEERKTATEAEEQAKLEKDCLAAAIEIFPNICRTYLSTFYAKMKAKRRPSADTFIGHILRAKKPYPTEPTIKQKRERERSLAEAKPRQSNFENIDYDKSDRASTLLGNVNEW